MRMKSVHLDRKMSATARQPRQSTIVESPAGKMVQPTDPLAGQRQEVAGQHRPQVHTMHQYQSSRAAPTQARPGLAQVLDGDNARMLRPSFARNNTGVMIVDEGAPGSPAAQPSAEDAAPLSRGGGGGVEDGGDGITLADIPQLMEAAQAREQHRSLPRQSASPFVSELSALELAIVRHAALLALHRSPLRNEFELEDLLELVEVKKGGFWKKIFGPGKDKKNVKQKGVFGVPLELLVEREGVDSMLGASRAALRVPSFIDDIISAMKQMGEQPPAWTRVCWSLIGRGAQTCPSRASSARAATSGGSRTSPRRSTATRPRSTLRQTTPCRWPRCSRSSCEICRTRC
jgi:hypothetical protein